MFQVRSYKHKMSILSWESRDSDSNLHFSRGFRFSLLLLRVYLISQRNGSVEQGLVNSCPLSWIQKFDTHLVPARTGHAACLVISSPSPFWCRLYQNATAPFLGFKDIPRYGNTVAPPSSTSDSYMSRVAILFPVPRLANAFFSSRRAKSKWGS